MKLSIEKHYSPDRDSTYYYIVLDSFTVFSTSFEDKARERFDHIKEVGVTNYFKEIMIQKTIILEEEIHVEELTPQPATNPEATMTELKLTENE